MLPPRRGTFAGGFRVAFEGLWWTLRTQRNMRVHISAGASAVVLGLLLRLSAAEMALLALTITLVLAAEMINTVIEVVVDLASPEYHPLAKTAKDVSAAMVLITALGSVVIGLLLFVPHLLRL